jgi:pyridoxal phosphate enzyme (YggS family)
MSRINIQNNLQEVLRRIKSVSEKSNRASEEIEIVAVSKTHPPEAIAEAVQFGIKHIGESRIQEAEAKFSALERDYPQLKFARHLVGHLQTNKVVKAIQLFDLIHSVDTLHLGQEISQRAQNAGKTVEILIQVNTSGEKTKFGVEADKAILLTEAISQLHAIRIKGLMAIGKLSPEPEEVRSSFQLLRRIFNEIAKSNLRGVEMRYLSMGMTSDFEIAVEEGANLLRIGTAIFGARD